MCIKVAQPIAIMEAQQGLCMLQTHFGVGADSGEQKRGTSGDEQFSRKQGETGQQIEYEYHPNKNVKSITYYKNNVKHREDGPAYVEYLKDGKTLHCEKFFVNGKLHRDVDAPALIIYMSPNYTYYRDEDQQPPRRLEVYYKHDIKHRSKGPAEIEYYHAGRIDHEIYIRDGLRHRVDGPAVIFYEYHGGDLPEIDSVRYWVNGKGLILKKDQDNFLDKVYDGQNRLFMKVYYTRPTKGEKDYRRLISRDNGPAVIRYDKDGNVEYKGYWYRGTQFDNEDDYYERIHFQLMDVPVPYRYVDETAKFMYDTQEEAKELFYTEEPEPKTLESWKQYVKKELLEKNRDKDEQEVADRLVHRYGPSVFSKKAPKQ